MSLQDEINAQAKEISRESYQMSIGELINLYKDGEMDIHPEFQRVFRWSDYQKTRLIESVVLNIPIPPIFVSQNDDGTWDVIDGVQRLSTIFQFVGIFQDEHGKLLPSLTLQRTDYLPSFAGVQWKNAMEEQSFTKQQQLDFKRSRLDVIIMKKQSNRNVKYELFQRLNTGGSLLSDQEVRNCLMIMTNKEFYEYILLLSAEESFKKSLPITDRKTDEQYRLELLLRLLIPSHIDRTRDWSRINQYADFAELLDKETLAMCNETIDKEDVKEKFCATFRLLYGIFDENAFKRYNGNKYVGPVMAASFQAIAVGVFHNINSILSLKDKNTWLTDKVQSLYSTETFKRNTTPGVRSIPRFKDLSLFGIEYFKP